MTNDRPGPTPHTVQDRGPVLGAPWIHFCSFILLILGAIVAFGMWGGISTSGDPDLIRSTALIILLAFAAPTLFTVIQVVRLKRALGNATLYLPYDSLPLGFSGNVTYVRPLREGVAVETIEVRLQCEESIIRGSRKNRRVIRRVVIDEPLTATLMPWMNEIRVQIPVTLPRKGPATFRSERAGIRWWLRMRLRVRGAPNTRSSFQLDVLPAVMQ